MVHCGSIQQIFGMKTAERMKGAGLKNGKRASDSGREEDALLCI